MKTVGKLFSHPLDFYCYLFQTHKHTPRLERCFSFLCFQFAAITFTFSKKDHLSSLFTVFLPFCSFYSEWDSIPIVRSHSENENERGRNNSKLLLKLMKERISFHLIYAKLNFNLCLYPFVCKLSFCYSAVEMCFDRFTVNARGILGMKEVCLREE
jgi:hypothetical protein